MPQAIAHELLLTGKGISAQRAFNFGFINNIVPREQLMNAATAMANTLCEGGSSAVRVMKQVVCQGRDLNRNGILELSERLFRPVVDSEDTKEGFQAFLEKRKPIWIGK